MNILEWIRFCAEKFRPVSERTGLSIFRLFISFEICKHFHGASMEHFLTFRMYEDNNFKRSQYMTLTRAMQLQNILDKDMTEEDQAALGEKHLFCRNYADFIRRETLYIPDSTPEQLRGLIARSPRFVIKEIDATQGKGVRFYDSDKLDVDALLSEIAGKNLLMEAFIRQQHPALAALNPATVNTVRVVTARHNGQVMILSSFLRVGGAGQEVDNFHHGGVVYHLDIDGGFVILPGKDELGAHTYVRHPTTGHIMPGFQVPFWDMIIDRCREAAMRPSHVGLVGWDVAVLPDGIEFLEANTNLPGPTAMQLWGPGVLKKLRDFIETTTV